MFLLNSKINYVFPNSGSIDSDILFMYYLLLMLLVVIIVFLALIYDRLKK